MGQTRLLKQELESGRLITPFNKPMERAAGYYLRTSTTQEHSYGGDHICEWIPRQVRNAIP